MFKNILVIDNEPFICDIFSQFLSCKGYDVQTAKSNDEALEFLAMSNYDLILSDIHMKGMSFNEFLKTLKNNPQYSKIPIIAVTGIPQKISSAQEKLIDGILEKPFTPDVLLKFVQLGLTQSISQR